MDQLKKQLQELRADINKSAERIDLAALEPELLNLQKQMEAPDFWSDNRRAQELSKKEAALSRRVRPWRDLISKTEDYIQLASLDDPNIFDELSHDIGEIENQLESLKKELRFNSAYDDHDVIMNIYAGAGGTDAQDWAQMLMRMYVRWAEANDLKVTTIDQSVGDEAGIKSATLEISGGNFLYGKLAGEHGVHRLVRKSPFNSAGSRETSFARVEVLPAMDAPDDIKLDDKDLRIDVFRAGG
ncbi:MAG TPA: PCRF domain-containing protein, partial [Candidatus Saccharimonadales bacterium]|nr:PCRF domain-containing protein [Candidatus Saccharimonadales bacterium]